MAHAATIADLEVGAAADAASARVGPNAIIQIGEVLRDRLGDGCAYSVFEDAGLTDYLVAPPSDMVCERKARALFDALFDRLDRAAAMEVAREAGSRTADYVIAHRIPAFARLTLIMLPAPLAAPLLLQAIARHAWTFAGSGGVTVHAGSPHIVEIDNNPITMPGCVWHVAVFERLFQRLVAAGSRVSHRDCCGDGGALCRFEITVRRSALP